MLVDMHAHTSGISTCCRVAAEEVIAAAKTMGIDGIILTNHYFEDYIEDGDSAAFAKRYVEEFHKVKAIGDTEGVRVWFGVEVTMKHYHNAHLLLYGVSEAWLLAHHDLYDYTLEEMGELVHAEGAVMIGAHPYRWRNVGAWLDPTPLDGEEVNSHPLYDDPHYEELAAAAQASGKLLTLGSDYHGDTHRITCGVVFPDNTDTMTDILTYLQSGVPLTMIWEEHGTSRREIFLSHRATAG